MISSFPDPENTPSLSLVEMASSVDLLLTPEISEETKGAFLTALHQRGETAEEMAGLAGILLERSVCPEIPRYEDSPLVELCGTGGDRAGLLNISTAAMFVVAGAGMRVVKHGNRAVSSRCGSADVLEALGVRLHLETGRVNEVLEQAGCVFLLASDYHRVVAFLAPLRRALAARDQATIFNLLGPLLNPVKPEYQLTGVYRREMLSQYAAAMGLLGRRKAWAVHGEGTGGGLDELTVTGCSHVVSAHEGKLDYFEIHPELIGLKRALTDAELKGGDALENAGRITEILSGDETGTARDMIVLNAAAALYVAGKGSSLPEAIALANESIDSGGAFASLKNLRRASQPRGV